MQDIVKSPTANISVQIVEDSITQHGHRMTTMVWEYPRMIHAEVLRHRTLNHSVSSSRAIPIDKVVDQVINNPAKPLMWGKIKKGMVADGSITAEEQLQADDVWASGAQKAVETAKDLQVLGIHKQTANRVLEPWQNIREVVTGTDFENFFKLRISEFAQPEFHELALLVYKARQASVPRPLGEDDWHMPYVDWIPRKHKWAIVNDQGLTELLDFEDAVNVSMSCCAQASYRTLNNSVSTAKRITSNLLFSDPCHASPAEHIGRPFSEKEYQVRKDAKINLVSCLITDAGCDQSYANQTADRLLYSGNLKGFVQYRNLIPNNVQPENLPFVCDVNEEEKRFKL